MEVIPVSSLQEAVAFLRGEWRPEPSSGVPLRTEEETVLDDFADVRGQAHVKRAMKVAAPGMHNLLFIGPPGSGKTMLARRLPSVFRGIDDGGVPGSDQGDRIAGHLARRGRLVTRRPFRSLTTPSPRRHRRRFDAEAGGGRLSHRGFSWMRCPSFLKAPWKCCVNLGRSGSDCGSSSGGAHLSGGIYAGGLHEIVVPCGYFGYEEDRACTCTPQQVRRYRSKLSGPLLDRIDIHVEVPRGIRRSLPLKKENPL